MSTDAKPGLISPTARTGGFLRLLRKYALQIAIVLVLLALLAFFIWRSPITFLSYDIYNSLMSTTPFFALMAIPLTLAVAAAIVYLVYLLIRVLRKYLRSGEVRQENREAVESLAKALKGHRERCRMTQEFVAEAVGVSRQAVSK